MIDSSPHRDEVPAEFVYHNQPLALPMDAGGFLKLDMIPTESRETKREEARGKRESMWHWVLYGMEGTLRLENPQLFPGHSICPVIMYGYVCPEDRQIAICSLQSVFLPDGSILYPSADLFTVKDALR